MTPEPVDLSDLAGFDASPVRGFLPDADPLRALPGGFEPWEELAGDLGKRLLAGTLRDGVRRLPLLDDSRLRDEAELRCAMRMLSFLGHAYVWGGEQPLDSIPAPLAVPWRAVAARLGRPPVLSYASYALDNWRRLDPAGPIALENLAILQNFLGGADEDWFILVHVEIEARAAPILRALGPALAAARDAKLDELEAALATTAAALEEIACALLRMPEHCDPYVYYRRVRPFIHGWRDQPELPHGVRYEGVDAAGAALLRLRGETGAQSTLVPALDALLGVTHRADPLRAYLSEMRDYMPPGHHRLLAELERSSRVRACVLEHSSRASLAEAYDACLAALERFRSTHLEYAARYIHAQTASGPYNPTDVGTGGTPFMPYLGKHRDETSEQRLR